MPDKRDYERFRLEGNLNIRYENNSVASRAYLENISFGGLAIYAAQQLPVDKTIEFELSTGILGQPLNGSGRVRYANASGGNNLFTMGVEFTEINRDTLTYMIKKIQAKIAQQARDKAGAGSLDFMPY